MLRVESITKDFASTRALDSVSFEVRPGRIVGFLGPNGAGKTTTLRAVMGLVATDAGDVTWNGEKVDEATRRRIGYLPAERGMYPRMSVRDHLTYYARLSGIDRDAADRRAREWSERLDLTAHASQSVQNLSSGNQQRVQLALALITEPDLLLLDEPFSGLDPIAVGNLRGVLRNEADRGAAILLSSHQLDLVSSLCASVVVVDHGSIVLDGDVAALRAAAPMRLVDIEFDAPVDWQPTVAPATRMDDRHYRVHLDAGRDDAALVADARATGALSSYSYRPPDLSEIFVDALARRARP